MATMTRIGETFARCKSEGRAALVGYLTAFDPDRDRSFEQIVRACEAGLDVIELGVAFSDPNADGPDVEGAMVRALRSGSTLSRVLALAGELRSRVPTPIVLFSYGNPLWRHGPARLAIEAKEMGVDGVLVVDVPPEHASVLRDPIRDQGLDWIQLVAPTTTDLRMKTLVDASSGFVYAVTLRGVTGAALDTARPKLARQITSIRAHTQLPIAAGFGIRTPEQAHDVARYADGVVVGSALIQAAQTGVEALTDLVGGLRSAVARSSVDR